MAATASTIKSLPTEAGLSIMMFKPVFTPGPTTRTSPEMIFSAEAFKTFVRGGTTEDTIPPSTCFGLIS